MQKQELEKSNLKFSDHRVAEANSTSRKHRKFFIALWLITAILSTSASAQEARKPEQAAAVVRVDSGQLQGVETDGVISFKGIPFAAPPVGELRWRPPQPAPRWTGVRQAAEFGRSCMQGRGGPPPGAGARAGAPAAVAQGHAASSGASRRACAPGAGRGLPVFERLASS
jgi:hypothetical protein